MNFRLLKYAVCLFLLILLTGISRCYLDHGLEPIHSKITGTIYFQGEIPNHSNEVRVAVVKNFPPRDIKELIFSDQVNFRQDSANYELHLPRGTYEVVAVIWKEHNQPWNISNLIGVYGGSFQGDLLLPAYSPVTIHNNHYIAENVNIQTNLDRVNRDAKIRGTIAFKGEWPEDTGIMAVGAFSDFPEEGDFLDYYFKSVFIDYGIPIFINNTEYELRVRGEEEIKYIAVLWINNFYNLSSMTDAGYYTDPMNTSQPGSLIVPLNSTVSNIDITVNFNNLDL